MKKERRLLIELLKEEIKLLKEYGNRGPKQPKVYLVKNDETFEEVSISEVTKISNLIYDMGGGETSLYDEYNVVVIDNFPIKDFAKYINDNSTPDKKLYISYNLENSYSFPKADEIIISQLIYHLENISNFAETVNNSLKLNGKITFFSDIMCKEDKEFLKTMIKKYGFHFSDNIKFIELSKYKNKNLTLQKE